MSAKGLDSINGSDIYMTRAHHYDHLGVPSAVRNQLTHTNISVQETEGIVFEGAAADIARIHLDHAPPQPALGAMRADSSDLIESSVLKLQANL
jgi:hypothetical protein